MKKIILFSVFLFFCLMSFGQNVFKGTLIDASTKHAVPFANVILMSLPDSTLIKGAISNEKGAFELVNSSNGQKLVIKFTHLEYKEKIIQVNQPELGAISLEPSVNELGEVVVSVAKPIMQQKGTVISTNIAESTLKSLPQLSMVLNFLPGVSQSFESGVQVYGKSNPIYYINNRKVRDFTDLLQLSPQDIERIDIETEPGAEHDNSVGAIIRIILKKKQGDGLSGILALSTHLRKGAMVQPVASLNYRTGNTDLSLFIVPNHHYGIVSEQGNELSVATLMDSWQVKTSEYQKDNGKHLYTKIGVAHEFNEKHSAGASVWVNINPYSGHSFTDQQMQTFKNGILTENGFNAYDRFNQNKHLSAKAYYEGQLSEKIKFQTDIDYSGTRSDHNSDILEKNLLASSERNVKTHSDAKSDWLGMKTTITQQLSKGSLSYGVEGSTLSRHEDYQDNFSSSPEIKNKELQSAVFVSYSFPWGKTNFKAGLRYEYTDFEYFENNQKNDVKSRSYRNLLPNVSLSFPWDKTKWSVSYVRKIRRPAFYELSDYSSYTSSFLYNRGNPNVVPRLSEDVNLLTSYKNYSFSVNYSYIKNGIYQEYLLSASQPNVVEKTLRNFDSFQTLKFTFSTHYKVGIWNPKFTFVYGKQFAENIFAKNDPIFSISSENQFVLSERWTGILEMNYRSKGSIADVYYENNRYDVNLFGIYTIPKYSTRIYAGISDIFNTYKNNTAVINPYITNRNYVINNNSRQFVLGFMYQFNPTQNKYKGQNRNEEESSRM
ncbi:outer membrane beta-barrel family protein [Capnocytophaga catalasegens]|nr:outer membrane beta-barrel family protein [Capnocytophaga catalasegens]